MVTDGCGRDLVCPFRAQSPGDVGPRALPSAMMVQAFGLVARRGLEGVSLKAVWSEFVSLKGWALVAEGNALGPDRPLTSRCKRNPSFAELHW